MLQNFGTTNVDAQGDPDQDSQSNAQEYLAGTDPNLAADVLKITSYERGLPHATYNYLIWNSKPSRYYLVQTSTNLAEPFTDFINLPTPGWNNVGFDTYEPTHFYRVSAYRPLMP